jgi:outer membrane autotransporter protein
LRTIRGIFAATLTAGFGAASPAVADCTQSGLIVTCAASSPAGFTAGAGVNGLTLQVLGGATVGNTITLNDGNTVRNLGTVSTDFTVDTAIILGDNNTLANSGTLASEGGLRTVSFGKNTTITNTGTIASLVSSALYGGDVSSSDGQGLMFTNSGTVTSRYGILAWGKSTIVNTGTMTAGLDGIPIANIGNGSTIINSGRLETGAFGIAVLVSGDQASVTNTGTMKAGSNGNGIYLDGNRSVVTNDGSIEVVDFGAGVLIRGDSAATNTGSIRGSGPFVQGMVGSTGSTLLNRGTIVLGDDSIGIQGFGATIANTGSITVGDAQSATPIGMLSAGNNLTMTNGPGGTITAGRFGIGMLMSGTSGTLVNDGSIVVGSNGWGILLDSSSATAVNNGSIVAGPSGIGINDSGSGSRITNTGQITVRGPFSAAVLLGQGATLTNAGTITAPTDSFSLIQTGSASAAVSNTGTLDGPIGLNGTAGSTLANSGLITISAPWTSAVQHQVDGVFTQMAGGTLALRVSPTGASDSLAVLNSQPGTGIANLGGTLRALLQPGLYANTTTYAGALTFAGSSGRFASVASGSPFFDASAVYNAASVDLVLTRIPFGQVAGLSATANGRAVGAALEAGYSPNLTGIAATAYGKLLASTSPAAIAQLSGEIATAASTGSFAAFGRFFAVTSSQTDTARTGPSANSGGGNRVALAFGGAAAHACLADACDTPLPFGRRVTAWTQGFGAGGSVDGNAATGSARVDMSAGGGAVGIDVQLTRRSLLGLSLGMTSSGYSLGGTSSYGSGRAILLGVYGSFTEGPAYLDAALGYGTGSYNTTRVVSTGTIAEQLTASFDGQQYGGRVEAGWRFDLDRTTLTPFAGLLVQAFQQNGYSETARDLSTGAPGALGLAVQGQTTTSVRSFLGAEARSSFTLGDGSVFSPRLRAAWAHEYNPARSMTAALATLAPASTFTVQGAGAAVDALVVGVGFDLALTPRAKLFAQFDGDLAANARSFAGTGGVKLTW